MKFKLPIIVLLLAGIFFSYSFPVFANLIPIPMERAPFNQVGRFNTDLLTGTANYSYPLKVPKGTDDLTPEVTVSYNSSGTKDLKSYLGIGWQLNQDYVERDVNFTPWSTGDDKFKLHFKGAVYDLVYVAGDGRYHTKVESFLNIKKLTGSGSNDNSDYWQVITKDGTKYRLGYQSQSELICSGQSYVNSWNLDLVTDVHDNKIYFTYLENSGLSYLDKIEYNNDQARIVDFIYESNSYSHPVYSQGCSVNDQKRLDKVQVKISSNLVREYDMSYITAQNLQPLLDTIVEKGSDGTSALPATRFDYFDSTYTWNTSYDTYMTGSPVEDFSIEKSGMMIADVNGDALPDAIQGLGHWKVSVNQGASLSASLVNWGDLPSGVELTFNDVRLIDVTGDNLPDVVKAIDGSGGRSTWNVYRNTGTGWDTTGETWVNNDFIDGLNASIETAMDDVNGDGLTDIVKSVFQTGSPPSWKVYKNTGSSWNVSYEQWDAPTDMDLSKPYVRLVDVNGDGLSDLVKTTYSGTNATWYVYKNTGTKWGSQETWINNANIDAHLEKDTVALADANGDGLVDIIKGEKVNNLTNWKVLLNQGNSWSTSWQTWINQSTMDADPSNGLVRLADINGDGITDIVRSDYNGGYPIWKAWRNNGSSPDLLTKVTTSEGGEISFDYKKSTSYDNTGADNISDLPFSMWTVFRKTVSNGLANSQGTTDISTYSYKDGLFDWEDKEFRGFETVTETLPNTTKNVYTFLQDDGKKGMLSEQLTKDSSDNPFKKIVNTWSSTISSGVSTVKLDQEKQYTYDGVSANPKIVQTDHEYDSYGNVTKISQQGDTGVSGDERFTYNEYTINTTDWIVNTLKKTYKKAADDSTKVSETSFYYDGLANLTDSPTKGDITKELKWIDAPSSTTAATLYAYDSYGNQTSITDPNSRTTTTAFGSNDTTYTYPDSTTNAKNQTTTTIYDLGTGNLLSKTDPNEFTTSYTYDVFGRITKEIKPYDSSSYPTVNYQYMYDGSAPEGVLVSKRETSSSSATLDTYTFTDGLGRTIQTRSDAEDTSKQIVINTFYDPTGEVKRETVPHLDTTIASYSAVLAGIRDTEYTYDPIARVIAIDNPKGDASTKAYDHWKVAEVDESGKIKRKFLNAYDKILKVEEVNGVNTYTTNYVYNARDDLTQITDNASNSFNFTYDSLSRKIAQSDPDMGDWSFEYDGVGNLKKKTDARGVITTQTFDQLDRILTINYPTNKDTTYTYDGGGKIGTLTSVSDGAGTVTYSYDNRLRKTQEQRAVEEITMTTQYTYDALDRITSKTNPDSTVVTYDFNSQGEIDEVTGVVDDIDYNALGKITQKDFANSLTTNYTYNTDDFRLNRIQTGSTFDSSYTYDAVGNITNIVDNLLSKTQHFDYDDLDRLTSASESAGFNYQYQYNPIGNLTQFNDGQDTIAYTYGQNSAGPHALTSSTENGVATPSASTKRYAIYDDGLASGWHDWSWSSTNNLNDTSQPYIGTKNISWKINSAFAGLKFHKDNGIDTTGYTYLTVAIKASESGQLAPQVKLVDTSDQIISGSSVQLSAYGGDPVVSGYRVYSVPLSALNGSNRMIGGVIIQDITGSVQPVMFVDSVALTGTSADDAFTAEFFNNETLSGPPELTRMDSSVNFDWIHDGYDTGAPPDHFSARWTKTQSFEAGDYKFSTTTDDGVRMYLDNELLIDHWNLQGPTTYTVEKAVTGGLHDIRVEYFEHEGDALAQFSFEKVNNLNYYVYDEMRRPGWNDASWSSTVSYTATTSANTGTKHIKWNPTGQWAGLYLQASGGFTTNDYTHLSFAVKATQSNQPLETILFDNQSNTIGSPLPLIYYGGNPIPGRYTVYSIPLADLGGENRVINGFNIKDISGSSSNELLVDSIRFVNAAFASMTGGFYAEYFNNKTLTGSPNLIREDSNINFTWGNGSYSLSGPVNEFSARWTKSENFTAGDYEFSVTADDGIRLYIDNTLVIDEWHNQSSTTYTAQRTLTAGSHDIKVEYYEDTGGAVTKFSYIKL